MKIDRIEKKKFIPIQILLETEEEANALKLFTGKLSYHKVETILEHSPEVGIVHSVINGIYSELKKLL